MRNLLTILMALYFGILIIRFTGFFNCRTDENPTIF